MPTPVTYEATPVPGNVRVGIEIEGVGSVSTKWNVYPSVSAGPFHDVFKRMKLVRSNSFSATRGVYITPEDADTFGKSSPAELVSSPHLFTPKDLVYLRNSIWKSLSPKGARTGQDTYSDPRVAPPSGTAPVATSRWGVHRMSQISGSLQTTIGVSTANLLSDIEAERKAVIGLLVGDETKALLALDLLKAAVAAEPFLTAAGQPLAAFVARKFGIRLAIFFWLADTLGGLITAAGQWTKECLGANFKGYSSFVGCNVAVNNTILQQSLAAATTDPATVTQGLISAIYAATGETWLTKALPRHVDLDELGEPGHAFQTSCEGWYAIPNFTDKGELYTVVESREKSSVLNMLMAAFLNKKVPGGTLDGRVAEEENVAAWRTALTQASALHGAVAQIVGA